MDLHRLRFVAFSGIASFAAACGSADGGVVAAGDVVPTTNATTVDTALTSWDRTAFLRDVQAMPDGAQKHAAAEYAWRLYDASDVRHSFTTPTGSTMDCVVTAHQPALRLPDGSFAPIEIPEHGPPPTTSSTSPCPADTVARPRPDTRSFARWSGRSSGAVVYNWYGTAPFQDGAGGYEHARAVQSVSNQGVNSILAVYDPKVATAGEHSISQVWVMGQSGADCANADSSGVCQSVEAGWNVDPSYGDTKPHMFIYSTPDNYRSLGCWALDCPNFVLLNQGGNAVFVGGALPATKVGNEPGPDELAITVTRQASNSAWYIWMNGDLVGYFLPDYYKYVPVGNLGLLVKTQWFTAPGLRNASNLIRYGGEVINLNKGAAPGKHTTTQMGTGNPASGADGASPAAYQRDLLYYDASANTHVPSLSLNVGSNDYNHPACYSLSQSGAHPAWWGTESFLYFGGSGYNGTTCK